MQNLNAVKAFLALMTDRYQLEYVFNVDEERLDAFDTHTAEDLGSVTMELLEIQFNTHKQELALGDSLEDFVNDLIDYCVLRRNYFTGETPNVFPPGTAVIEHTPQAPPVFH